LFGRTEENKSGYPVSGPVFELGHPEYKAGMLTTPPRRSIQLLPFIVRFYSSTEVLDVSAAFILCTEAILLLYLLYLVPKFPKIILNIPSPRYSVS
jgi:hypothetical protein